MAIILLAWELGGGLGHASQLLPLASRLQSAGHDVVIALRDLRIAAKLPSLTAIRYLQSPHKQFANQHSIVTPRTFAHVLWNAGHNDPIEVQRLVEGWEKLFDAVSPDLIVFDHAPTALLAARGRDVKRVVLGNGFCCPRDCSPLPDLRPWLPPEPARLAEDEARILDSMNQVLERRGAERLNRITQLYDEVDDTFLTTFCEFDHYPNRAGAQYRGPWSMSGGKSPVWPAGSGKRIYAYLSVFPGLPKILHALGRTGCPTIVFGGLDQQTQARFAAANVRFESRRIDLKRVAAECDVAVLNGGQATTLGVLLAGKPILQAPIFLEQAINALNTVKLGAGMIAFPRGEDRTVEQLAELLSNPRYTDAARKFADRYASFSVEAEMDQAAQRLNELACASKT